MPFRSTHRHIRSARKRLRSPTTSHCRPPWLGWKTGGLRLEKRYPGERSDYFQHSLHLGILLILPIRGLQHQADIFFRYVLGQFIPVGKAVLSQFPGIPLVSLGVAHAIIPVIARQHGIDHRNVKNRVMEPPGHWRVVVPCRFNHQTGLTVQTFEALRQGTQFTDGVRNIIGRAFLQYKICNRNPSFSRCRFNLLG